MNHGTAHLRCSLETTFSLSNSFLSLATLANFRTCHFHASTGKKTTQRHSEPKLVHMHTRTHTHTHTQLTGPLTANQRIALSAHLNVESHTHSESLFPRFMICPGSGESGVAVRTWTAVRLLRTPAVDCGEGVELAALADSLSSQWSYKDFSHSIFNTSIGYFFPKQHTDIKGVQ